MKNKHLVPFFRNIIDSFAFTPPNSLFKNSFSSRMLFSAWSFTHLHFPEFIRIIFILYMFFILNFLMPHCDAASLATPAVVSHEGRLSVATGSQRRGNFICQVKALTLRGLKHYLFAKIATALSFSRRHSWPRLPCFSSFGWALFSGSGGGVQGRGGR